MRALAAFDRFASRVTSRRALLADLHTQQRAFVEETSPVRAALCSRRAGKTHGIMAWLIDGALDAPGALSAYVGLNKAACRRNAWAAAHKLNTRYELGLTFGERDGQLQIVTPNRHTIWLAGCGDASEIDKFRGATDGFVRVVVDEAQAFAGYLQELVEDALEPALLDRNGQLALTGTPAPVCAGYFHAVTTGEGQRADGARIARWPTHHWTVLDNPAIPHARAWLEQRRVMRGWDVSHPTYRREWLGEWVSDAGALVYPISRALNQLEQSELPDPTDTEWVYALGVDLGHTSPTAFVLVGTRRGSGRLCVLRAEQRAGMLPAAIGARIQQIRAELRDSGRRLVACVIDEGGLGAGYAAQFRADGIECEAAEKRTKRAAQDWLRGLVLSGSLRVDYSASTPLVNECSVLSWDDDGAEEDSRFSNHCADAMLYACRRLGNHYRPEREPPTVHSEEWHRQRALEWRQSAIDARAKRTRRETREQLIHRLANR